MLVQQGRIDEGLQAWGALLRLPQAPLNLVADDLLTVARQSPEAHAAALALADAGYAAQPSLALLLTRNALEPNEAGQRLRRHLHEHPTLSAASALVSLPSEAWCPDSVGDLQHALDRGARPLQRYRCAACGFEAQRYFWQCPGCMGWDTYPTQRVEDW
jgi:lipopolysaccharide biosynthesis regulator YciM